MAIHAPQLTPAQAMDLCGLLGAAGAVTAFCAEADAPADETVDLSALRPMAVLPGTPDRPFPPAGPTACG